LINSGWERGYFLKICSPIIE
jgi:hypothetical protein